MIRMVSMLGCLDCIDDKVPDGECECAVPMPVCNICTRGPLDDGEEYCGELDCASIA